jgi:hypothetical protein
MTGGLSVWTIYDHPSDYPDTFVAREWRVTEAGFAPTQSTIESSDLEYLRRVMIVELGKTRVERSESDDPKILESWV